MAVADGGEQEEDQADDSQSGAYSMADTVGQLFTKGISAGLLRGGHGVFFAGVWSRFSSFPQAPLTLEDVVVIVKNDRIFSDMITYLFTAEKFFLSLLRQFGKHDKIFAHQKIDQIFEDTDNLHIHGCQEMEY
jgi:hypothetical protein